MTLAAAVALLGLVGPATSGSPRGVTFRFEARLSPKEEVPPPTGVQGTPAGQFVAFYAWRTRTLIWMMRFGDLTGQATAAHIHMGKPGATGNILVHLCGPCPRPSHGTMWLTSEQASRLRNRPLYVNIHTAKNPAGEIRGRLSQPAEPTPGCQPC